MATKRRKRKPKVIAFYGESSSLWLIGYEGFMGYNRVRLVRQKSAPSINTTTSGQNWCRSGFRDSTGIDVAPGQVMRLTLIAHPG